jgi:FAD/FMN-containing dehydrogenase
MAVSEALDLILPDDPRYDEARTVWNAAIDRRPAAIVRCTCTEDVVAAVRLARERGWPVAVRGGGHNVAGLAVADGALVVDCSQWRGVRVDGRVARVAPGTLMGELDTATQALGLAAPGGIMSTTGVAGFTLGGGIGWLTRRLGPACDGLLGAEVVTANGDVIEADGELLWGLRGGGGNFGVVTRFDLSLHKVGPTVVAGIRVYPLERLDEVLAAFGALSIVPGLAILLILRQAPPAPWIPADVHGRHVAALAVCGELPVAMPPDPLADSVRERPYVEWQRFSDASWVEGFHNYWKAQYLDRFDAGVLAEYAASISSPMSDIKLWQLDHPTPNTGAFGNRDARLLLNINTRWNDGGGARHIAWTRALWEALLPCSSGGVYVNFLGDEGADRVREAFGEANYARLVALKRRYDPENVFRVNQNISLG